MARVRAWPSLAILGLPLEKSENPFLAVPVHGPIEVVVEASEGCEEPRLEAQPKIREVVGGWGERLLRELDLNACVKISAEAPPWLPPSSLYTALTAALLKGVASEYGEELEDYEIIENARLLDPWEEPHWQGAVDAMRLSSLRGAAVVYRNDEEYADITMIMLEARLENEIKVGAQKKGVSDLGTDLYGAIIHTVGVMVLEATMRLREDRPESLAPLLGLQSSLAGYFWSIPGPTPPYFAPGVPGVFHAFTVKGWRRG